MRAPVGDYISFWQFCKGWCIVITAFIKTSSSCWMSPDSTARNNSHMPTLRHTLTARLTDTLHSLTGGLHTHTQSQAHYIHTHIQARQGVSLNNINSHNLPLCTSLSRRKSPWPELKANWTNSIQFDSISRTTLNHRKQLYIFKQLALSYWLLITSPPIKTTCPLDAIHAFL